MQTPAGLTDRAQGSVPRSGWSGQVGGGGSCPVEPLQVLKGSSLDLWHVLLTGELASVRIHLLQGSPLKARLRHSTKRIPPNLHFYSERSERKVTEAVKEHGNSVIRPFSGTPQR
ncbi:hypothetical protein AAFF_G00175770 [Aldrovandia affinis]|uniref:Uncharacterized protein n=1 Tax=Aldrovandia affinis TaxID=143900 RepID=A0AAD7RLQ4_9TELE|nr:hypothetical protein AAFF_G00175770 [Aldrovandia affinis]